MSKKLPIFVINGDRYIFDEPLEEFRHTENPSDKIPINSVDEVCVEMDDEMDADFVAQAFDILDIHSDGNMLCFDPSLISDLVAEVEIKESLFSTLKKKLFGEEF